MKKLKEQTAKALANVSLEIGKVAANTMCFYIFHQPKMPKSLKKMRKF